MLHVLTKPTKKKLQEYGYKVVLRTWRWEYAHLIDKYRADILFVYANRCYDKKWPVSIVFVNGEAIHNCLSRKQTHWSEFGTIIDESKAIVLEFNLCTVDPEKIVNEFCERFHKDLQARLKEYNKKATLWKTPGNWWA